MQRFDFVFSYLIFAWYLLFVTDLVPYNPLPFLVVAAILNVAELSMGFVKHPELFVLINICIKAIPIYSIQNVPVRFTDVRAGFLYLFMYITWMYVNKEDYLRTRTPLTDFIKDKYPSLVNG
jgi:hypothetical protein